MDSVRSRFIYETELPLSLGVDMTDRSPFSSLRLPRRMISLVCFLYASRTSNHLSTCSPPSFSLSSSSDLSSPPLSLSLPITLSLHGIINIAVRCRYLYNPVDSISRLCRWCTEGNRTEPNRARTALGQRQRIGYKQERFLFSAVPVFVSASVRAADFIGAAAAACMSIYSIAVH